jgi:hypothetical protein
MQTRHLSFQTKTEDIDTREERAHLPALDAREKEPITKTLGSSVRDEQLA